MIQRYGLFNLGVNPKQFFFCLLLYRLHAHMPAGSKQVAEMKRIGWPSVPETLAAHLSKGTFFWLMSANFCLLNMKPDALREPKDPKW